MNYMLLICSDGVASEEKAAAMREHMPRWIEEMDARGVRKYGHALKHPSTAVTVRARDGQTLLSDGPFAETKEFIGGFDLIECADLDEAIEVAAKHPVSWFHRIEIRPFADARLSPSAEASSCMEAVEIPARLGAQDDGAARRRYLLVMCLDGIPGSDEEEASITRDAQTWLEEMQERGVQVFGHALKHADTATTVQVRNGEKLLSDGPFAEAREFVGGFDIIEGVSREEAIEIAAKHPLARFHMVEVRPFAEDESGEE
jgi:hypothetical protein